MNNKRIGDRGCVSLFLFFLSLLDPLATRSAGIVYSLTFRHRLDNAHALALEAMHEPWHYTTLGIVSDEHNSPTNYPRQCANALRQSTYKWPVGSAHVR